MALSCSRFPSMLNQNARILHHRQSRRSRLLCRLFVFNSQLHPHHFCSHANRALNHGRNLFRPPENVHDIYAFRYVLQSRVASLSQHFRLIRIHRNNSISRALHVLRDFVARTPGVRRQSNHRNRLVLAQNVRNWIAPAVHRKLRPFRKQPSQCVFPFPLCSASSYLSRITWPF